VQDFKKRKNRKGKAKSDSWDGQKTPSFISTPLDSPVTQVTFAIRGQYKKKSFGSGTAVSIGPGLLLTAAHVIDDFLEQFRGKRLKNNRAIDVSAGFGLQFVNISAETDSGLLWEAEKIWCSNNSDMAIIKISPTSQESVDWPWKSVKLRLRPPKIGEKVSGFGYALPKVEKEEKATHWIVEPNTSTGEVVQVHNEKRDSVNLPFPCFEVNARYDGAMSGGPVFNDAGEVCGIVCSTLTPYDQNDRHSSYIVSLWPLMGLKIDYSHPDLKIKGKYPVIELAKRGIIVAKDFGDVSLYDDNGKSKITMLLET